MTPKTETDAPSRATRGKWMNAGLLLFLGIAGGMGGYYAGVPAGFMIGSMLLILIVKLLGARIEKAPSLFGEAGNILLGTFAGALFDRDTLANLGGFLLPALAAMVGLIVLGLAVAWLLAKVGKVDLATCLFGLSPGGIAQMIAASKTVGADVGLVVMLQLLRLYVLMIIAMLFVRWLAT